MRGLYAIVDTDSLNARGVDPVAFAEAVLEARPAALQLRDKRGTAKSSLALLRSIGLLARRASIPFYANDRPDLALLAGCDGVHVGQDDLPVEAVRLLAARASPLTMGPQGTPYPGALHTAGGLAPFRVGVSTHSRDELTLAVKSNPDYVAIGPVFGTQSKLDAAPLVGIDELRARVALVREQSPGLTVVAIGGVSRRTAAVVGALCDAVAVIGALIPPTTGSWFFHEVRDRARALCEAIAGGGA
jgi:thiamine-phosphate pyrophosphorylase